VDLSTDGPLPGREEEWGLVIGDRVRLAIDERQWAKAERLQHLVGEHFRERAAEALGLKPAEMDRVQRNSIRSLGVSIELLGQIQLKLYQPSCVASYKEALALSELISDRTGAAICALNLGHAYNDVPTLRDLTKAEEWYQRSLKLFDEGDYQGQAKALAQLGFIAFERFNEGRKAEQPKDKVIGHAHAAIDFYHRSLNFTPSDALDDLATDHYQLGNVYTELEDFDRAFSHYHKAIRYRETAGNLYGAASARFKMALALGRARRYADARQYISAALRGYQAIGDAAAADIQHTQAFLDDIDWAQKETRIELRRYADLILASVGACDGEMLANKFIAREQWRMQEVGPRWIALAAVIQRIIAGQRNFDSHQDRIDNRCAPIVECILSALSDRSSVIDLLPGASIAWNHASLINAIVNACAGVPRAREVVAHEQEGMRMSAWAPLADAIDRILAGNRSVNEICDGLDSAQFIIAGATLYFLSDDMASWELPQNSDHEDAVDGRSGPPGDISYT
jgi:tetratricopeptide (TPR) repeat protein